ncbi:MAG: tetratricopeptide repeat protein [Weeksellaceae bacterium]|nr:tetratricopeptide repeat protein [Weeksellaceae bacterium]
MKKTIFYIFLIFIVLACAAKRPEKRSRFLKGFSTEYNTLFNAKDALNTEFSDRTKAHKDNFYAPYINLLTYEEQPVGSEIGQSAVFAESAMGKNAAFGTVAAPGQPASEDKGATILEIAEAKALKTIDKYSVIRDGQEKNDKIFDAYITLAQSRIYMGKYLQALDALNTVFVKMKDDKRLPLAKIYQGLAYAKMKDYFKANEIFVNLKTKDLKKDYQKLLGIYYSESLLESGKKDAAIAELGDAFEVNGNRKLKSRIAFLRGQILASQGKTVEARESFVSAYKFSNDFEFEVKSQVEIAKTYNSKDDYTGAKKYLEGISKKGTYASRKNEFYYALGLMAANAGKKEEAKEYFMKSLAEKVSDPQIRGLSYYEIGRGYLNENEYIAAGAYYDSAITAMTYEPTRVVLQEQSNNIKKLAKNYYLVKKNDSMLALAKMTEPDRIAYFNKYIEAIKLKEEAAERERTREERSKGFDTGDYSANSIFAGQTASFEDFGTSSKGFYFGNTNTVSKGSSEFKQIWGTRTLSDNWRYSAKMSSLEDAKNEALGITSVADPRRFEPSFYIEKIPRDAGSLAQLKKDRDTASLGMGIMYDDYFSNTALSTKTLYDLVDNRPEEKVMLQALYEIFAMNYEKNPSASERAKQILLTDYPYSSYAEFARNPRNSSFVKSNVDAENAYQTAFTLYEGERFDESRQMLEQSVARFPNDALIPKFALLNAFIAGKTSGKEVMILQLEQIALNYEKTPEGERAKQMLIWLKSDLQVQMTDDRGNVLKQPQKPAENNVPAFGTNPPNVSQKEIEQKQAEEEMQKVIQQKEEIRRQEEGQNKPKGKK